MNCEFLHLECRTLWRLDGRGRLLPPANEPDRAAPLVVIATASDGWCFFMGAEVGDALAREIESIVGAAPPRRDPSERPGALERCDERLREAGFTTALACGPSYLVPPGVSFVATADIVRSNEPVPAWLATGAPPEARWEADEWASLLSGALGPWAMAVDGQRVLAICHSARLTAEGAEAGVWTHPEHRGRGLAASVTAAWAGLFAGDGRTLFYSTSADNRSSQQVAARLGLPIIGWTWQIHETAGSG